MNSLLVYSVVGVRADKSRMTICRGVTKEQAEKVKKALTDGREFSAIEIEDDKPSTPELDLTAD